MLSNYINTVKSAYQRSVNWTGRHYWDIALFLVIFLAILGLLGLWRLKTLTPQKTLIRFEQP